MSDASAGEKTEESKGEAGIELYVIAFAVDVGLAWCPHTLERRTRSIAPRRLRIG